MKSPRRPRAALLTPKQQRFVAQYLVDLNATQAAIGAGYSKKTAKSQGQRLLTHVDVAKAIAKKQAQHFETADIAAQRVLEELGRVAFSNIGEFFDEHGNLKPMHELTEEQRAVLAVREVIRTDMNAGGGHVHEGYKIRLHDKLKALELLAKHFALLTDVSELRVSGRLTVEQVGRMSDEALAARLRESLAWLEDSKSTACSAI